MWRDREMKKKNYKIGVHGCDDSTIFEMELTDKEAELIDEVCKKCTQMSEYDCMPTMDIEKTKDEQ
jgi:hypothetical protein